MNVDFMGWNLTDVAPENHPNAGLTILQRMEKYNLDPEGGATSYNRLMSIERAEAVKAGIAPAVPITAEAASVVSQYPAVQEFIRRQRIGRVVFWGAVGFGAWYFLLRKRA